ncbi:hypothetical protein BZL70_23500 [Escherichia coli]|nr:hypothetical protein BZL70_23500 [Escherichia coli]
MSLRIFLPKLGWMRYRNSRQVTGIVKNVTVSQSCGKWYISIQTEREVSTPVHPSASMVGLDAGVAKLATLSDGTVFEPVNSFQKNQKKLARLQRQLSRKVKFSNNWQKQKRKIQRLHSSCCGHTAKENRLSQSKFRCQACGYTANADVNGARNILAAGHAVLACGEMVQSGRSLKQEPPEMI